MLTYRVVRPLVETWFDAWNRHDLEAIMALYSDDVEVQGQTIAARWDRPDGRLRGKEELRSHFGRGLELAPNLHFELEEILLGPEAFAVLYRRENSNRVVDVVHLNAEGLVTRVEYFVVAPQP